MHILESQLSLVFAGRIFICCLCVRAAVGSGSVYDVGKSEAHLSQHLQYIDYYYDLRIELEYTENLTAMYAPNEAWEQGAAVDLDNAKSTILQNHVFEETFSCARLQELKGQKITSMNRQEWLVSVNEDGFPCFETITDLQGLRAQACVTVCDRIATNGIVQELDRRLLFNTNATNIITQSAQPTTWRPSSEIPSTAPTHEPSTAPTNDPSGIQSENPSGTTSTQPSPSLSAMPSTASFVPSMVPSTSETTFEPSRGSFRMDSTAGQILASSGARFPATGFLAPIISVFVFFLFV